jgi:replicative DNA helicase
MLHDGKPIDAITLTDYLRGTRDLDRVGGPAFIVELFTLLPTAINVGSYVETIREMRTLRNGMRLCMDTYQRLQERDGNTADLIEGLHSGAMELIDEQAAISFDSKSFATDRAIEKVKARIGERMLGQTIGLTTGLKTWDNDIGPIVPGLIALGARQKMGKTALIEGIIEHIQLVHKRAVILFEIDTPEEDVLNRMACRRAGVVYEDFMHGKCKQYDLKRTREALDSIDRETFRMHSPDKLSTENIQRICTEEMKQRDVAAVFLDVFTNVSYHEQTQTEGLTRVSKDLRRIQRAIGIPFIVLTHLNREADKTTRPSMGQLKASDQLFSDCDLGLLLWSEEDAKECFFIDENGNPAGKRRREMRLTVDANRSGSVGDYKCFFDGPMMRFFSTADKAY